MITKRNRWRFHFPSHAGNQTVINPQWDQTELPELDVLGNPTGTLLESQKQCAQLFEVSQSFYLINGASVGLMASLLALSDFNGPVLVARNAHRSVIHGLILSGLETAWMLPEYNEAWGIWGELQLNTIQQAYSKHANAQAVVLTYPTYEGMTSNITEIIQWCHHNNLAVIVDEAHGTLWHLSSQLPVSAIEAGADIIIHSMHKSAGALTQCALLHVNHHSLISPLRIQQSLSLLQTTSPSYLLLSNMESVCQHWASEYGRDELRHHIQRTHTLKQFISSLNAIDCLHPEVATSQLLLQHQTIQAEAFATKLENEYDIAFESLNEKSVLLHLNTGLPDTAFDALQKALLILDQDNTIQNQTDLQTHQETIHYQFELPLIKYPLRHAYLAPGEYITANQAIGRVSREIIATCPPGIPIIMPGEIIQESHLQLLPDKIDVVANP